MKIVANDVTVAGVYHKLGYRGVPIIAHTDVKRMLLFQRAVVAKGPLA